MTGPSVAGLGTAAAVLAAVVAATALASCGGSGAATTTSSSGSGVPTTGTPSASRSHGASRPHRGQLTLAADPSGRLRYSKKVLRSRSDDVSIYFTNHSPLPHNVTIAPLSGKVLGALPTFDGGSRVLSIKLKPGRYMFYCSVPGHRAAGMQGTLIVR